MRQTVQEMTSELKIHVHPAHRPTDKAAMLTDLLKIQQCTRFQSPSVSSQKKTPLPSGPLSNRCENQQSTNQNNNCLANSVINNNSCEACVETNVQQENSEKQKDAINANTNESCFSDITNCSTVIKSGTLVLIIPQQSSKSTSASSQGTNRNRPSASRCPVTVKIHSRAFEKYAIITQGQRRHITSPPICVQLRNIVVTWDQNRPTTFVVVTSGVEGRYFQFEASSQEAAQDWIEAFSTPKHHPRSPRHHGSWKVDSSDSEKSTVHALSSPTSVSGKENNNQLSVPQYMSFYEQTFPSPVQSPRISRNAMMPVLTESFEETDEDSDN